MTPAALSLVLLSALLHAAWNFFNKDSVDKWGFFAAQGLVASVLWLIPLIGILSVHGFPAAGWPFMVLTILFHAGYAIFLTRAYETGDLSVVYPLSRTAPALVALWESVAAPGSLTAAGAAGTVVAGLGAIFLQWPALRRHGLRGTLASPSTRYALIAAVFIAAFTVVDKQGVKHLHPFAFLYFIIVGEAALAAVQMGRAALRRARAEMRVNLRGVLFTATAGPISYLLILWALTTEPASYVLGLRQCSVIFGVILGRVFLGEGETVYRLIGSTIIAAGVVLIAVAG